jgi:hypothetical protein
MYSLKFAKKVPFIFHKIQVEDNMAWFRERVYSLLFFLALLSSALAPALFMEFPLFRTWPQSVSLR